MIIADTSAWIEFLRATESTADQRLQQLVGTQDLATTDAVVAELTAGARTLGEEHRLRGMLDATRFYPIRPLFDYEHAARIFGDCRRSGFTPSSLIDCLIAAVAIDNDLEVLHHDIDFDHIAEVVPLSIAEGSDAVE